LRLSRAGAGSGVQQQPSDGMMKSIAAFEHLAVANVASIDFAVAVALRMQITKFGATSQLS